MHRYRLIIYQSMHCISSLLYVISIKYSLISLLLHISCHESILISISGTSSGTHAWLSYQFVYVIVNSCEKVLTGIMIGLNIRQAARATVNRVNQLLATSSTNFSLQTAGMSLESEQYPPIEATMRKALKTELKPVFMEVINESPMHNTPKHAESHFRVFVVSDKFNDLTLIKV